jgi:hypothetical protein
VRPADAPAVHLAVADHADHGHELALGDVGGGAAGFDALDHRLHVGASGALFHHNHHLDLEPFEVPVVNPTVEPTEAA